MTSGGSAPGAARRAGTHAGRIVRAWRGLPSERRLAVWASLGLFLTLFLPWYQETVVAAGKSATTASLTGWASFSFVEAAVLVVAGGVLTLVFERADGRAFHLPGGDGWVITAAGTWTCVLVVWRILDKQSAHVSGPGATVSGVEWGIFIALAVAALLTYAGSRIRAAGTPEPSLPDDDYDFPLPARRGRQAAPARTEAARRAERQARREAAREKRGAGSGATTSTPASAAAAGAAPQTRPTRVRRPPTSGLPYPVPDALEDPPTLRIGDHRSSAPSSDSRIEPESPLQATDEQLTIPFDDVES